MRDAFQKIYLILLRTQGMLAAIFAVIYFLHLPAEAARGHLIGAPSLFVAFGLAAGLILAMPSWTPEIAETPRKTAGLFWMLPLALLGVTFTMTVIAGATAMGLTPAVGLMPAAMSMFLAICCFSTGLGACLLSPRIGLNPLENAYPAQTSAIPG